MCYSEVTAESTTATEDMEIEVPDADHEGVGLVYHRFKRTRYTRNSYTSYDSI